jgi:hypothetical protein
MRRNESSSATFHNCVQEPSPAPDGSIVRPISSIDLLDLMLERISLPQGIYQGA